MSLSSWYHQKLTSGTPWHDRLTGEFNQAHADVTRRNLNEVYGVNFCEGLSDEEVVKLSGNRQAIEQRSFELDPEPRAVIEHLNGKLYCSKYNSAFIKKLRTDFAGIVDDATSDADVVKLYVDRENIDREEPYFEILHSDIVDGVPKIKLDWNRSWINLLKKHGFTGETDDDIIYSYLGALTTKVEDELGTEQDVFTREQIETAFSEIQVVADRELDEAAQQLKKKPRRRKTNG